MAALTYRAGLARYRRYIQAVQERPLLQASLFVVFSLVLIIVLVAAALRPTIVTIAGLLGQISEQTRVEQQMDAKIAALATAQQNYQAFQSKLQLLDQAIPTSAQFALWSDITESLVETNGLEISSLALGEVPVASQTPSEKLEYYSFNLTVKGSYDQLKIFLNVLENTRRLLTIESISLSPSPSAESDARLTLAIRGRLAVILKL